VANLGRKERRLLFLTEAHRKKQSYTEAAYSCEYPLCNSVNIFVFLCENKKRLFIFLLVVAALIVFAVTAAKTTCSDHAENAQEKETVGNPEEIIEIYYSKEFGTDKEADDTSKHQQGAEYSGSPSEIINDCTKFHIDLFW
jgi:hypothetical protein